MGPNLDLAEIESFAYRSYFEDGMWDLFFGTMFIIGGARTMVDNAAISLLILVAVLVPVLGKMHITIPRLGVVRFGPNRERARIQMLLIVLIAVIISVSILVISPDGLDDRLLGDVVFAGMVIVVTGALGHYLEYPWLIVHGFIFAAIMLISGQYGLDAGGYAYVVGGAISLTIGFVTLHRFLGRYPVLTMEG